MEDFGEALESLKEHLLDSARQNWLLGAGVSYDANIPLMYPLTDRVVEMVDASDGDDNKKIIASLSNTLLKDSHVEHFLSQLGDLIALASRSKNQSAIVDKEIYTKDQLKKCYQAIVEAIGITVRYGYGRDKSVGSITDPIVSIDGHLSFVEAIFKNRQNLENRSEITFFTTNYDTLLEDALALNQKLVIDGFSGGAIGFWDSNFSTYKSRASAHALYKLHGSIDWHHDKNYGLVRARYGTTYLSSVSDIMIYPQATKYVETQRDPFSSMFAGFRSTLNREEQNVLITCGYSFGDEHINSEIETCLNRSGNKTTVLAFIEERPAEGIVVNEVLDRWLSSRDYGSRIFVAGKKGIYNGSTSPYTVEDSDDLDWWTFSGMTEFLTSGEPK